MKKTTGIFLIAVFLLPILSLAACGKKKFDNPFPLAIGNMWEYNYTQTVNKLSMITKKILRVTATEKVKDTECFVVSYFSQPPIDNVYIPSKKEYLVKAKDKVVCLQRAFGFPEELTVPLAPGEKRLQLPADVGTKWEWSGMITLDIEPPAEEKGKKPDPKAPPKINRITGKFKYEIAAIETKRVMNQDFECLKVKIDGNASDGSEIERTEWYANDVGLVAFQEKVLKGINDILIEVELAYYNIIIEKTK